MTNYTKEQLQAARVYAASFNRDCAKHAFDSDYGFADHVTFEDKQNYVYGNLKYAEEIEAGEHDHNFTVRQRMEYYLTGESVPFLPRIK
jgi:hypothetical protein